LPEAEVAGQQAYSISTISESTDGLARRRRAIDKITPSPHLRMAALLQKKALLHRAEEGEQAGGHGKRVPEAGAKGGSKRGARCPATCR
jgi:hypothetical protein